MKIYRYLYNLVVVPIMWCGFNLARPFSSKVHQGLKGRASIFEDASRWRKSNPGKLIIIHSASAGEFEATVPFIEKLKERGLMVVSTVFSPSGFNRAEKLGLSDLILYLPGDFKHGASRFLDILTPEILAFCKHDIWPNMIWEAEKRGIPSVLLNGNLPADSSRIHPLLIGFFREVLGSFTEIYAVAAEHADRFRRILGDECRVIALGDTRFDRVVTLAHSARTKLARQFSDNPVFIAGSVWQQEHFTLKVFLDLKRTFPQWRLIWVEHEPVEHNLVVIERMLDEAGMSHIRFSAMKDDSSEDALIVDKVGVLPPLYSYARIAYVGGGFGKGVHSVIEPAAFSIPVIFGPHHQVSAEAGELLARGGGFSVKDGEDFRRTLETLMRDTKRLTEAGAIAGAMVAEKTGVTDIVVDKLMNLVKE